MAQCELALDWAVVFEGSALGVSIRRLGWHVEVIKDLTASDEFFGCGRGQFAQETSHDMPPSLLPVRQVESFNSLLGCLVGGEAGPLVTAIGLVLGCGLQVPLRL